MANLHSAGLLMYRRKDTIYESSFEVFIVHPGGPLFVNKDEGVWTIPKGLVGEGENLLAAAQREFEEETGIKPIGMMIPLGSIQLKSGKVIYAWAFEYDIREEVILKSNYFALEWPPESGRIQSFPEVDRGNYFTPEVAKRKLNPAQAPLIDMLARVLPTVKRPLLFE